MTDPKTCKFSFFSDGQAMIKSLAEMRQWPYYYPNATLAPDWDVLQAIKRCLEQLDSSTMLTQVKGHQDDDTNFADLPLQAQLNVKADAAAGAYQYHDKDHQRTTLVDGAGVLLHSPDEDRITFDESAQPEKQSPSPTIPRQRTNGHKNFLPLLTGTFMAAAYVSTLRNVSSFANWYINICH
eukprot:CAMPEP_0168772580 /NCGR_PEP_ID=MMETSP0725-20121227/4029_1 /TAXON_ID=265536 /ORGANISM="Amphiprora sp., Strain CCMP467" /LENGTH=181 /DNA_ID=CAMNT_0008822101 /DNA_START=478 /DNA_END=1023 /DNA_ORIENTATION=-